MPMNIGHRVWAIAEGYLPPLGPAADDRTLRSHETACILNAGASPATLELTIYFQDREPIGPYRVTVPARRTHHLRFDDLEDPEPIPRQTDYSAVIVSDQPVVVQHTRLDARPQAFKIMTTTAFGQSG
jgi:hypothetical protein